MQVNHGSIELRLFTGPALLPPRTPKQRIDSTTPPSIDNQTAPQSARQGSPNRQSPLFGNLLQSGLGPLPPTIKPSETEPSPLGEPPHVDRLATRVRDYRDTLGVVNGELTAQLKLAKDALQDARKSGDVDSIAAAQTRIDHLNRELKVNRDSLSLVQGDVKDLRELRQQLIADVKAGNLDAMQKDRNALTQQRDKVLADLQA